MSGSIEEFLGGYRPPRISITVTQRADLLAELTTAANRYERLKHTSEALNGGGDARSLLDEIERLSNEIADSSFDFDFEAISRHEYQRLIDAHPPTEEHRANGLIFNADTFPQALVARCAVRPKITPAQAAQLMDTLSESQFTKLWNAAASVNIGDDAAPKFVRPSRMADEPEPSSDTPLNTPSPEASSSDE